MTRTKWLGAMVAVAVLATANTASAVGINGSLALAAFSPTQNGADLSLSTIVTASPIATSAAGSGDYSPVPALTPFGNISLDLTQAGTGFGLSMSNATYGSFVGTGGSIVSQSPSVLSLYVIGDMTPFAGLAPADEVTQTSVVLTFNMNGDALSGSATLNSPALPDPTVPEPASLMLVCGGLATLLVSRRKR